jgi:hypothetical protein
MQSNGQLHHPKAWRQMTAGFGHRLNDKVANILGELVELWEGECADIGRRLYPFKE